MMRQILGLWVSANELSESVLAGDAVLLSLYEQEVAKLSRSYGAGFLSLWAGNFAVVDATKDAYVTDVVMQTSSSTAISITITGKNLPPVSLQATLGTANCTDTGTGGSTSREFFCVPTASSTTLAFKTFKNDALIPGASKNISIIITPPIIINIPATAFVRGTNVALSTNGYGADTLANAPPYGEAANAAEWDFNVPMAGTYELVAEYAAAVSRPVTIAFNGAVKFPNALATVTGGWFPANRQTISQGFVTLPAGVTTMRVSRGSVFPHIRGFNLVPVKSANLLLGAQVSDSCASCPFDRYGDPNKLTDGDVLVAARNLGTYIGNFNVTLPYPITLDRVVLTPAIAPNGVVSYEILTSTDPLGAVGTWTSHGGRISKFWTGGVALETPLNTVTSGVRVVRLVVYASPSWVSLTEIQGFNGGSPLISGTFSVPANNPTGTLFTVPTGVGTCTFNASGSWNYGFGASSSAAGVQSFNGDSFGYVRLLPSTPYFSLIANTAGGYRAIGSGQTVSVSGGQSMQFQINEGIRIGDSYADNSGALSVSYQCQ